MLNPPTRDAIRENIRQTQRAAAAFLLADVELALTMLDHADVTNDLQAAHRARQRARIAYGTVLRFAARATLDDAERSALEERLARLRRRLSPV